MKNPAPDSLSMLTDAALLDKLNHVVGYGRRVVVRALDFLNEVEARRLHFRNAYPSMFAFCRKELRFSEGEATRKIAAARLIKRFPAIREALEAGTVHMTALALVQSDFTEENVAVLLDRIKDKTKREVEQLVGEMHPSRARPAPRLPNQMRKLPATSPTPAPVTVFAPLLERASSRAEPGEAETTPPGRALDAIASPFPASSIPSTTETVIAASPIAPPTPPRTTAPPTSAQVSATPSTAAAVTPTISTPDARPSRGSSRDERYAIGFEASRELRDKLQRLRTLMAHENPTGDLAKIVERAADLLIAKIEKERFGQTERPRKPAAEGGTTRPGKDPSHISNATKRIVLTRDGWRCSFVGENGERCTESRFLQFDHIVPRALGGTGDPTNVRVTCRPHNLHEAEQVFGKEKVRAHIRRRQRRQSPQHHVAASGASTSNGRTRPKT